MATHAEYPVRVEARLDPETSRWLWLVKWLLAIPHFVVLAFLWIAFFVLSVGAFFAILFTGRYPRGIFEFNVGVLRWSWRVSYYSYGALATDRYPPFTLQDVPDYPARLAIAYPEQLSRGLVLVKWWLLAIPHYLIVGLFVGGAYFATREGVFASSGLIEILAIVAAVILLFTGRYPRGIFDLVLGLNRWVLRVAAYAGLMTDEYPPFRLDMGGSESGGSLTIERAPDRPASSGVATARKGWGAGQVITVIAGALTCLLALGLLAGGGVLLWVDRTQRDATGFVSTPEQDLSTPTAALVAEEIDIRGDGPDALYPDRILGDAKISVTGEDEIFVGIGRSADVRQYLAGASYGEITDVVDDRVRTHPGDASLTPPADEDLWAESRTGSGTQTLRWEPAQGRWSIVVMNADAANGVDVRAEAGAEIPSLPWFATALLIAGLVVAGIGVLLIVLATRSAGRPSGVSSEGEPGS